MDNSLQSSAQSADVNWAPLSLVITSGTPKRDTHPAKSAEAQSAAVIEDMGTASGQRDVQSMMVKM
jgi:hypothetical protein